MSTHIQRAELEMNEAIDGTTALLDRLALVQNENSRLATLLLAKEAAMRALNAKLKIAEARARYFEGES
ncbi:MAG: hypothetical protein ACREXY_28180 [Gammaproteobacteria bacterium]